MIMIITFHDSSFVTLPCWFQWNLLFLCIPWFIFSSHQTTYIVTAYSIHGWSREWSGVDVEFAMVNCWSEWEGGDISEQSGPQWITFGVEEGILCLFYSVGLLWSQSDPWLSNRRYLMLLVTRKVGVKYLAKHSKCWLEHLLKIGTSVTYLQSYCYQRVCPWFVWW
jgi:hypothetical protein